MRCYRQGSKVSTFTLFSTVRWPCTLQQSLEIWKTWTPKSDTHMTTWGLQGPFQKQFSLSYHTRNKRENLHPFGIWVEDKMNQFLLGPNFVLQRRRFQGDCFYEQNYSHASVFPGSAPKSMHFFSWSNYFSHLILTMLVPNSINITTIFSWQFHGKSIGIPLKCHYIAVSQDFSGKTISVQVYRDLVMKLLECEMQMASIISVRACGVPIPMSSWCKVKRNTIPVWIHGATGMMRELREKRKERKGQNTFKALLQWCGTTNKSHRSYIMATVWSWQP